MHFGATVLDGDGACYLDHLSESAHIPIVGLLFYLESFVGVVDECAKGAFLVFAEAISVHFVHFLTYHTGGVLDHVDERTGGAVKVGHEMFGSFGQGKDSAEVHQFGDDLLGIRKFLAQKA